MRRIVSPSQNHLFSSFELIFSPLAWKRIKSEWQGVFRHVILELMPVDVIAGEFSPNMGRPTKELYSMAGLVLVMEFKNWTKQEAADAYMFHSDLQYALNLDTEKQSMCERTIERYQKIFRENDLAEQVMHDVTICLAENLELDVSRQRLDSTHVFSDMATFGRTRLMGVSIKRFLNQVKRHDVQAYQSLPAQLRERYKRSEGLMFADVARDSARRRHLRQEVAEDLLYLIDHFAEQENFNNRPTYKDMVKVFAQQCEIVEDAITIKAHPGGNCLQNPSDPDATYDGKKGAGYQVQLAETCSPANEVQLITCAICETAAESDAHAVDEVLTDLEAKDLLPEELDADTAYGSDENEQLCKDKGVELVSPVAGKNTDPGQLNTDDFVIDELTREVTCCPAGREPIESEYDSETEKTTTRMATSVCGDCPFQAECPVKPKGEYFELTYTAKARRLDERRREQATAAFRERYTIRSGIESTNSGIKRRTGLDRVRVRGRPAVFHSILLKIVGWNIFRASASGKMRKLIAEEIQKARQRANFLSKSPSCSKRFALEKQPTPFWPYQSLFRRQTSQTMIFLAA